MDVSDRRLQVQLTQQAKIPANSFASIGIFAFAGFVCGQSFAKGGKPKEFRSCQSVIT